MLVNRMNNCDHWESGCMGCGGVKTICGNGIWLWNPFNCKHGVTKMGPVSQRRWKRFSAQRETTSKALNGTEGASGNNSTAFYPLMISDNRQQANWYESPFSQRLLFFFVKCLSSLNHTQGFWFTVNIDLSKLRSVDMTIIGSHIELISLLAM